jgi:LacI family transcriptional regulator
MKPSHRPSMRDVAELAGVSLKTVSRVINGEAHVNAQTAERVNTAIRAIGFRRNDIARQLRQGHSTATIGLVIEDIANPFYSQVARGVEIVARERGCLVITGSSEEDGERERDLVQSLFERRVDGLIVVPSARDHTYLRDEIQHGTPIVFIDRPATQIAADTILLENRAGTRLGVNHLLSHGHTQIAFIGGYPEVYTGAERFGGYCEALQEAGFSLDSSLVKHGCHDLQQARDATLELLSQRRPPTAIFASSNRQTLGVIHALFERQATLAVVGFDDFELAAILPIRVTVLKHDPVELGQHAATMLFKRLEGQKTPFETVIVPVELISR